jgi:hypothetical protein
MTKTLRCQTELAPPHADEPAHPADEEPTWFLAVANDPTPEELAKRYRRRYNLPTDVRVLPPRHGEIHGYGYHDWIASGRSGEFDLPDIFDHNAEPCAPSRRPSARRDRLSLWQVYVLAALGAMFSGGSVGYLASQAGAIKEQLLATFVEPAATRTNPASPPPLVIAADQHRSSKPVVMAKLEVADVNGRVNSLIPLALAAEPAAPQVDLLLKISGLPADAYLTSGHRDAEKAWVLTLADLKDVKLMIPKPARPEIDVAVAAIEAGTGELAAPVKTMTIAISDAAVVPVAAPPPQTYHLQSIDPKRPEPADAERVANLLRQGHAAWLAGDVDSARGYFELAWSAGSGDAAMELGRTYDPDSGLHGGAAHADFDRTEALRWYERAAATGEEEASGAMARLRAKP